jgi:hypothetical protein
MADVGKLNRDSVRPYLDVFPFFVREETWRENFIADYGSSLIKESNYALAYEAISGD